MKKKNIFLLFHEKNIFYFSSLLSLLTQYKLCTAEKEWAMTIVPKVIRLSVHTFQPQILIYRRGYSKYHHRAGDVY